MNKIDETLLILEELYAYSIQNENKYLKDKILATIINVKSLEDRMNENKKNDEFKEVLKVKRKVPKWMEKNTQLNYKILSSYMKLSDNNNKDVSVESLQKFSKIDEKVFFTNYNGLKNISEKNHAKVFSETDKRVSLWNPIEDFIIAIFREYKFNQWAEKKGNLPKEYVRKNYSKALSLYVPENLKEYNIEPMYENIFLCTDIDFLKKIRKKYLAGGELKEKEKNKNLPSSLGKYIDFLENTN